MNLIKNINFEGLHLFETSILGKPQILMYKENTVLLVPCYQPVFVDNDSIEKSGGMCFLMFDYLEYYSFEHDLYTLDMTNFEGNIRRSFNSFNPRYNKACYNMVTLGLLDCGIGELSFTILCSGFHIICDTIIQGYAEIEPKGMLTNTKIRNHLLFPNLNKIDELIRTEYFA